MFLSDRPFLSFQAISSGPFAAKEAITEFIERLSTFIKPSGSTGLPPKGKIHAWNDSNAHIVFVPSPGFLPIR